MVGGVVAADVGLQFYFMSCRAFFLNVKGPCCLGWGCCFTLNSLLWLK